jgi:hypothetical protein
VEDNANSRRILFFAIGDDLAEGTNSVSRKEAHRENACRIVHGLGSHLLLSLFGSTISHRDASLAVRFSKSSKKLLVCEVYAIQDFWIDSRIQTLVLSMII